MDDEWFDAKVIAIDMVEKTVCFDCGVIDGERIAPRKVQLNNLYMDRFALVRRSTRQL